MNRTVLGTEYRDGIATGITVALVCITFALIGGYVIGLITR